MHGGRTDQRVQMTDETELFIARVGADPDDEPITYAEASNFYYNNKPT